MGQRYSSTQRFDWFDCWSILWQQRADWFVRLSCINYGSSGLTDLTAGQDCGQWRFADLLFVKSWQ